MSYPVWIISSDPASEPLTLTEVKNYLKVDSTITADDALITSMIIEARQFVERMTSRALINRTVVQYFDKLPVDSKNERIIQLHIAPLYGAEAASAFQYIALDADPNSYTAWDNTTAKYYIDRSSGQQGLGGPRIIKKIDQDWPEVEDYPNAVKFTYVAGYGTAATAIPAPFLTAMRRLIGIWYYHIKTAQNDWEAVEDLLAPYRVHK